METKRIKLHQLIALSLLASLSFFVFASCMNALANEEEGNLTINLPPIQSATRTISADRIESFKTATASYRVTVKTASGSLMVKSGTQTEFKFSVPTGDTINIKVECLDSGGYAIVLITKTHTMIPGRNSLGMINFSKDGHEVLNAVNMRMVYVAGGKVPLAADYNPVVSSFRMSETEVTQKQWQTVMDNDGYGSTEAKRPNDLEGKGDNFPMYYVSWYDALVFCNKLSVLEGKTPCYTINGSTNTRAWGDPPDSDNTDWNNAKCNWTANGYRLPTEAEWEYAARGGSANKYTTFSGTAGDTEEDLKKVGWYDGNSDNIPHEVNTRPENANLMKDMSGNVGEWCWDLYDANYDKSKATNPTGATSGTDRVIRGGDCTADTSKCQVNDRDFYPQSDREMNVIGFRVVCR